MSLHFLILIKQVPAPLFEARGVIRRTRRGGEKFLSATRIGGETCLSDNPRGGEEPLRQFAWRRGNLIHYLFLSATPIGGEEFLSATPISGEEFLSATLMGDKTGFCHQRGGEEFLSATPLPPEYAACFKQGRWEMFYLNLKMEAHFKNLKIISATSRGRELSNYIKYGPPKSRETVPLKYCRTR